MCVSWYLPRWNYDVSLLQVCEEGYGVVSRLIGASVITTVFISHNI